MGKQPWRKHQVLKSDKDVQPPPYCTQQAGTGTGGVLSQLRKVGNVIETLSKVPNAKAQNVVVPSDKPENVMALSPAKKKGTQRAKAPLQNTVMGTPTLVATSLPTLHIMDDRRFKLQDQPMPLGYVGSKPLLQSHQTLPEPDSMTPVIQYDVLFLLLFLLFNMLLMLPFEVLLKVLLVASLTNIMLVLMLFLVLHSGLFADDGSDGADGEINEDGMGIGEDSINNDRDSMGLNEDDIDFEEEDTGIEEDGTGIDEDSTGKENGNINMDLDYRNEELIYALDNIADPGQHNKDNTAVTHMDGNQQDHVQHCPGQAEKGTNCTRNVDKDCCQHSMTKAAHSNAPAIPELIMIFFNFTM
ncbi:hypothetical protein BDR06DRAFT_970298 [Suillus hirtellus]|nr:hypothetical protein BDR06DRAFT_970298 [Suillus hirtellus]